MWNRVLLQQLLQPWSPHHSNASLPLLANHIDGTATVALDGTQQALADIATLSHIKDMGRYMSCPFHAVHNYEFACFKDDPIRVKRIVNDSIRLSDQLLPMESDALTKLQNEVIVFFGDSLVRNQFVSFACRLWELDESIVYHKEMNTPTLQVLHSRKYNLEVQFMFHGYLLNLHKTNFS